jgi:GntR family transcriptional regulator, vanillate catabolism transcriptional regulator
MSIEEKSSQTIKALLALREMLLSGELKAGERLSELSLVEKLGASRTPVRMALVRLEEEGFLKQNTTGGFFVESFSVQDCYEAIDLRGLLEGQAARWVAERGVSALSLQPLKDCINSISKIIKAPLTDISFEEYVHHNGQFHDALLALANSKTLSRQLERLASLPFASPNGFVKAQSRHHDAATILTLANEQHKAVLDAIEAREGLRAEMLMREHAKLAARNLKIALARPDTLKHVLGANLIAGRNAAYTTSH